MLLAERPKEGPTIQSLKERHHEIKRRLVAGERAIDICRSMGMTPSWLSIVMSSPVFKMEMEKERQLADENAADVSKRLTRLAPDAMQVLEEAIRNKGDKELSTMQRVYVAKDVLDRAGHGKPQAQTQAQVAVKVEIVQFSAPAQAPATITVSQEAEGA
jgi:hypothetical protein